MTSHQYCHDLLNYQRRKTREVCVGKGPNGPVIVGGDQPIRIQSMTITNTRDTKATVDQIISLISVGCEMIRITAPARRDAENLGVIRHELDQRGINIPLVADIHFSPPAALIAADFVDKVRINPGNFSDRKRFQKFEYSDVDYQNELDRIEETFLPLVLKLKKLNRCLRIGTNHGSLSDRIMNRFGDTPEGMVESALEYVKICEKHDFQEIILSMKAAKPELMIEANRLLIAKMNELGMNYPIHLGVTEAGEGEDGRIKSAVGIGSLLDDGIGDTIRVSLTEAPESEIPVAQELVAPYQSGKTPRPHDAITLHDTKVGYDPYVFSRFKTDTIRVGPLSLGGTEPIRVEVTFSEDDDSDTIDWKKMISHDQPIEMLAVAIDSPWGLGALSRLKRMIDKKGYALVLSAEATSDTDPDHIRDALEQVDRLTVTVGVAQDIHSTTEKLKRIIAPAADHGVALQWTLDLEPKQKDSNHTMHAMWSWCRHLEELSGNGKITRMMIGIKGSHLIAGTRYLSGRMQADRWEYPLALIFQAREGEPTLSSAVELGSLLCDGLGDLVRIDSSQPLRDKLRVAYNILQGTGKRITKTEYISCPSCGRTLFDLQSTTERIRARTGHLKNVRIAVMGCIVNGPGEMADADFGYVGSAPGVVELYVGKERVAPGVPEAEADSRLIELIKERGKWIDPPVEKVSV